MWSWRMTTMSILACGDVSKREGGECNGYQFCYFIFLVCELHLRWEHEHVTPCRNGRLAIWCERCEYFGSSRKNIFGGSNHDNFIQMSWNVHFVDSICDFLNLDGRREVVGLECSRWNESFTCISVEFPTVWIPNVKDIGASSTRICQTDFIHCTKLRGNACLLRRISCNIIVRNED